MARNAEQLRDDIDSGKTGDKIAHPDPAAVPLGADEEAAGTPLTRQHIEKEQWPRYEIRKEKQRRRERQVMESLRTTFAMALGFTVLFISLLVAWWYGKWRYFPETRAAFERYSERLSPENWREP